MDELQRMQSTEVSPAPPHDAPLLKRAMPGLDVLRGLAVLLVVLYHGLYWFLPPASAADAATVQRYTRIVSWGWLGVTLFFVLSGFLITGILLDTRQHPHYWKNFYTRRLLRIFPALVLLLSWLYFGEHFTWQYVLACLFYLGNLAESMHTPGPIFNPLWSLAVEEQFYLLWPWLAKLLPRRVFAGIAVSCLVVCPALRGISCHTHFALGDPYSMTYLVADNLAMGACVAIFLRSRMATRERARTLCAVLLGAGAVLLAISVPTGWLHRNSPWGCALQSVPFLWLFAGLLILSLLIGERRTVMFWTKPLRGLGYLSYGLYLCHLLPMKWFDQAAARLGRQPGHALSLSYVLFRFVVTFAASIAISFLSRRYYEEFFLRLKRREAPYGKRDRALAGS
jgi:peptidoglycan/LPS O-acetylase OafA/YrhL